MECVVWSAKLQGVGGDEVPESAMKAFIAWVKEDRGSYVGDRGHTRGAAIKVQGADEDEEDKDQPKESPKDKDEGKDQAKDEPKEKAKDKAQRKDKAQTTRAAMSQQLLHSKSQQSEQSQEVVDIRAMDDEVVQRCKVALSQQMSVTLRDCVPSEVAKATSDASKSKAETLIGRLTKHLETERTGRANAEAWLDNERKRVKELEVQNESIKKQLVESNTKTAEAKQEAKQLLAVMAGNYKEA